MQRADHDDVPAAHEHEIEDEKPNNDGVMVESCRFIRDASKDE